MVWGKKIFFFSFFLNENRTLIYNVCARWFLLWTFIHPSGRTDSLRRFFWITVRRIPRTDVMVWGQVFSSGKSNKIIFCFFHSILKVFSICKTQWFYKNTNEIMRCVQKISRLVNTASLKEILAMNNFLQNTLFCYQHTYWNKFSIGQNTSEQLHILKSLWRKLKSFSSIFFFFKWIFSFMQLFSVFKIISVGSMMSVAFVIWWHWMLFERNVFGQTLFFKLWNSFDLFRCLDISIE